MIYIKRKKLENENREKGKKTKFRKIRKYDNYGNIERQIDK